MDFLTAKKNFPNNFPEDVMKVINAMTFPGGKVKIAGSAALRSMLYSADFDGFDIIKKGNFAKSFKNVIQRLQAIPLCYIGDIKAGEKKDWIIIDSSVAVIKGKLVGWNYEAVKEKVEELASIGVFSTQEAKEIEKYIKPHISIPEFFILKDLVRPQIVRWTPSEVLKGEKKLVDGSIFTLNDVIESPGTIKVDAVSWVAGNHFSDFSMLYMFEENGSLENKLKISIEEDILKYYLEKNWFKALKRHYSLAKIEGRVEVMKRIFPILNGDLGRIYSISSDIGTLLYLFESKKKLPLSDIRFELEQFKARFGNVYETPNFLKVEPVLLARLKKAIDGTPGEMEKELSAIKKELDSILVKSTPKF